MQQKKERYDETIEYQSEPKEMQIRGCLSGDYVGEWKDGQPHGEGIFTTKLGGVTQGTLRSGRWDGYCKLLIS